jgi:hypothetical protein
MCERTASMMTSAGNRNPTNEEGQPPESDHDDGTSSRQFALARPVNLDAVVPIWLVRLNTVPPERRGGARGLPRCALDRAIGSQHAQTSLPQETTQ